MSEVKLLPLPEKASDETGEEWTEAQMEAYARDNMEPMLAEIERLRAKYQRAAESSEHFAARAERLAEALRRQRDWWLASKGEAVSNAPGGLTRIDPGFIALCDAHVQQIDLALRDHDQEGKDGLR